MVSRYSEFIDFPIYLQVRTGRVGGSDVCVCCMNLSVKVRVCWWGEGCVCVCGGGGQAW